MARSHLFDVSSEAVEQGRLTSDLPVVNARPFSSGTGDLDSWGLWIARTNEWSLAFEWSDVVLEGPGVYLVESDGSARVVVSPVEDSGVSIAERALSWCSEVPE
ncbi:hypothetical protein [Demequina muriae]|uniref:Immunity protein 35 domain-containing protein n=1 Tax=Demequina muriae TaxID=3051664 RepID=A0ABT8GGR1_9MICO|nr:hypothetical protein [Demequina sp. EGI L300058]MDN4480549.1 hypothetical protein [Demequina sp. EGI L300058]